MQHGISIISACSYVKCFSMNNALIRRKGMVVEFILGVGHNILPLWSSTAHPLSGNMGTVGRENWAGAWGSHRNRQNTGLTSSLVGS
mmetsp:Transcript_18167/g.42350  ORF Transcript_18167/g.42350 Transcript_18167/m.42350 type:complete len:87 (+) Transcript_18167:113-373(+)